ncbi:hypothetical protein [Flavobacterium sp. FlaQc-48]|uniref:hypothetical protein n=1 Tax=Flavobacterium sp. FlaQc-48 TaxID=3374181 RepID=UPI0037576302
MAIQTLDTIKQWFKTSLKPTQTQFWDTWDSFRHKYEKVPVQDVEGIEELLNSKADKSDFKTINGETIVGNGNITIDDGKSATLNDVVNNGNTTHYDLQLFDGAGFRVQDVEDGNDIAGLYSINSDTNLSGNLSLGRKDGTEIITSAITPNEATIANTTFKLPIGDGEPKTLATLNDVKTPDINQVLETGYEAFDKYLFMKSNSSPDIYNVLYNQGLSVVNLNNGSATGTGIGPDAINMTNVPAGRQLSLNSWSGMRIDNLSNTRTMQIDLERINFYNTEPEGSATLKSLEINVNGLGYRYNSDSGIGTLNFPQKYHTSTIPISVNGVYANEEGDIELPGTTAVSDTVSGIVNNTELQELGGTDKTINGIRIGKGNANYENNLVIGRNGLAAITTGKYNVAIGNGDGDVEGPLQYLTTGNNNTMVGSDSGVSNITGNSNTGVGALSLFSNTTGNYNTAVGVAALKNNTTGLYNTAVGSSVLVNNTTGLYNTAIGSGALNKNQFGSQNIAIGVNALRDNVGTDGSNIYGHRSVAIGANAMQVNTTGHGIAIGNFAMSQQTTGTHNVSIGFQAGSGITTGNGNVIIAGTGFIQAGGGITTGNNNMIMAPNNGNTTGITTGNGNIILGKVSGLDAALENNIVISNGVGNIKAQNDGINWKFTGQLNKTALDTAPTSATATGTIGEIRYTANYIYVCTASNTWVRSALTTW